MRSAAEFGLIEASAALEELDDPIVAAIFVSDSGLRYIWTDPTKYIELAMLKESLLDALAEIEQQSKAEVKN